MSDRIELEEGYSKVGSSQAMTCTVYTVEARVSGDCRPVAVGEQIFDSKWRQVHFHKAPPGCPGVRGHDTFRGYYEHQSAQALRWWLHSAADRGCGSFLETRLVAHSARAEEKVVPQFAFDLIDRKREFGAKS